MALKPISLTRKLGPAEAAGPQTEGNARAPQGPPQGHRSPGPLWSPARELCSGWPARGQLEGAPHPGRAQQPPWVRGEAALSGLCLHAEAN